MFSATSLAQLALALLAFGPGALAQVNHQHVVKDLKLLANIHRRPANYLSKAAPNQLAHGLNVTEKVDSPNTLKKRAGGKINMAYFGNWDIYARNYFPANVPAAELSHVLYCFADIDPTTGNIVLSDSYADTDKHYANDSWNDVGTNVYGNFKQFYLLKQAYRHMKVSLSIGGWTYSQDGHFDPVVQSASMRTTFINSAITMLENFGLDGIDIDYEYPTTDAMASGYAALLTGLRSALNAHAASKGDSVPYLLTSTLSANTTVGSLLAPYMSAINSACDYLGLMAYDYAGSWSTVSDDMANLYPGSASGVNTQASLAYYISKGITASKVTMGMPIYGRAFEATAGIRKPFNGIGPGTWEAGVYDYNVLPISGASVVLETSEGASYSYDATKQELVSYDTPSIITLKSQYVNSQGLAGAMFWEVAADGTGSNSLITTSANAFGSIDATLNHLCYPGSIYANIQNNMGAGACSATVPPPTTSTTSTKASTTTTPTTSKAAATTTATTATSSKATTTTTVSGGSQCTGVAAWSSTVAYTGGQDVTYGGHLWTAKYWTEADVPGGAAGDWTDLGAC
ncbi:hypothetical protein FRB96_001231 [Tulasnella sp. 330]|nr:hypothetical protein FRB96_001231 [Tulasnella sp. 330]